MALRSIAISVIVATFNRPLELEQCLGALAHSQYDPARWEVIVVDDGSFHAIDHVIEKFRDRLNLRVIEQVNAGPASARNNGAKSANGKYVCFIDDDCIPDPLWISRLVARLENEPTKLVGGRIVNRLESNIYSTTSQLLVDYLYEYYNYGARDGAFFASNNFACLTEHFNLINGFDTRFPNAAAEDRDFCRRWTEAGMQMCYAAEALVYHAHALNARRYFVQHFNYGRGAFLYHKLKAERTRQTVRVEPVRFYFNLFAYPLRQPALRNQAQIVLLLVLSQIANVSGFFIQALLGNGTRAATSLSNSGCERSEAMAP